MAEKNKSGFPPKKPKLEKSLIDFSNRDSRKFHMKHLLLLFPHTSQSIAEFLPAISQNFCFFKRPLVKSALLPKYILFWAIILQKSELQWQNKMILQLKNDNSLFNFFQFNFNIYVLLICLYMHSYCLKQTMLFSFQPKTSGFRNEISMLDNTFRTIFVYIILIIHTKFKLI